MLSSQRDLVKAVESVLERLEAIDKRLDRVEKAQAELRDGNERLLRVYPEGYAYELGSVLVVPERPRGLRRRLKKHKGRYVSRK